MSEQVQHTPGPWSVGHGSGITGPRAAANVYLSMNGVGYEVIRKDDRLVAAVPHGEGDPLEDARRIVAAVNAVEGIPTEALEAGVVRQVIGLLERIAPPDDGWWCPTCRAVIDPAGVTFEERCEACGTYLGNVNDPELVAEMRAVLAKLRGTDCKTCDGSGDVVVAARNKEYAEIQDLFSASSVIIYDRECGRELAVEIRTIPHRGGMTREVREARRIEQGLGFPTAPVGSTWSAFSDEHNYCPDLIDVLGGVLRGTVELHVDGRLLKIYDNGFAFRGNVMEWPPWGVDSIPPRQEGDTDA